MPHHNRAILAQLSPAEREFYDREPARSWLAQMRGKLLTMTVDEGAKLLRANMPSLAPPAEIAPEPVSTTDAPVVELGEIGRRPTSQPTLARRSQAIPTVDVLLRP